ncbi:MAG: YdcF family protein [Acidobacteria bacterium]|nr:YdcF family protein [Acidobacteriota bacterium]
MMLIIDFFKTMRFTAVPFVVFAFGLGIALLHHRRTAVWARRWLTALLLTYWFLATPFGAWLTSLPMSARYRPLETREQARGAQAVVVLGGGTLSHVADGMALDDVGSTAFRLIEAVRVYKLLGDPLVVVSGGNTQQLEPPRPEAHAYREAAISLGVPASRIVVEDRGMTTREEAVYLKPILAARGLTQCVIVTSPTHMGRALAAFRAVGLDPVPSAARQWGNQEMSLWSIMPTRQSLTVSDTALYDYLATVYYWMRGWL